MDLFLNKLNEINDNRELKKYNELFFKLAKVILKNTKEVNTNYLVKVDKYKNLTDIMNYLKIINIDYYDMLLDIISDDKIIYIPYNEHSYDIVTKKLLIHDTENLEVAYALIHEFIHYTNSYDIDNFDTHHYVLTETMSNTFEYLLEDYFNDREEYKINGYILRDNAADMATKYIYLYGRLNKLVTPNTEYDKYLLNTGITMDREISYILGGILSPYIKSIYDIEDIIELNDILKEMSLESTFESLELPIKNNELSKESIDKLEKEYIKRII